jgi:peptide/nickel transport system substrate-binding protein
LDPAIAWDALVWQVLTMTNDGLLAYKRVGGPDGVTLVPDLATSLPQVSEDGLTYRFPLRRGVTYSTGAPVRPEDFRHGLERTLVLNDGVADLYAAIDGAPACRRGPQACDLSASIETSDDAVTFHLTRPDADMAFKLAMPWAFPVPTDVPFEDQRLDAVPATGPYTIDEAAQGVIRLIRNPSFREWSSAAQPDGFADEIEWRFGQQAERAFDQLEGGSVDVMNDPPTSEDLASLLASQPDHVFLSPRLWTYFVGFDVQKSPFDDPRVRQAVNYAIDRDHVVDLLGGPTAHDATCQILPPTYQGYVPFCPYTMEPGGGEWSAPDVGRASALIDEARADGQDVTVWVTDDSLPPGARETMKYVTEVMNDIGLSADLKVVPGDEYFGTVFGAPAGSPEHPQAFLSGWIQDYPAASNFLEPQFACPPRGSANNSGWCDARIDRQMDEAQRLYRTDPGASSRAWTEIEHQLIEEAVVAPLTNPVARYAVSARAGNVQINPQWGILLSRIWVE